jgi:hypothetical protein
MAPPGFGRFLDLGVVHQVARVSGMNAGLDMFKMPALDIEITANCLVKHKSTVSLHRLGKRVQFLEFVRVQAEADCLFVHITQ